jgi:hypothetical protein
MSSFLDWEEYYDVSPKYIKEEERYENVRTLMDELIVEMYSDLRKEWDLQEIHHIISCLAAEMDLYIPKDELKMPKTA